MDKKVYIAAPLFNEMELARNEKICAAIEGWEFETYLPQRDAGEAALGKDRRTIFETDITGMDSCDICVALIDGRTIDEGTCFEMGYMYAQGKPIIAYRTDVRTFIGHDQNVMIEFAANHNWVSDLNELEDALVEATRKVASNQNQHELHEAEKG